MKYGTALVTGASSGIGEAIARRLCRDGTHVVLCARRRDELARVVDGITRDGGSARVQVLDVADTSAAVATIRALDAELGGLDLVVANAGLGDSTPARTM